MVATPFDRFTVSINFKKSMRKLVTDSFETSLKYVGELTP